MTLLLLPILLLLPAILLLKNLLFKQQKLNYPPSPPKLPIIGNLHQVGSLPHRSFHSLSLKHGPLMLLHIGQTPTLVVSSPDLIKQIVKSHDITFSNRPQTTGPNIIFYNCRDMGFSHYGEYWRQARKLCVMELLSIQRVQSLHNIREEEVKSIIKMIDGNRVEKGFVDLTEMIQIVVSNIVGISVLGRRMDGSRFGELTRDVMVHLAAFYVGDYFPWLRWVDVVNGHVGRVKKTFEALDGLFDEVIHDHKRSSISEDDGRKDFVHILLQLQKKNMLDMKLTQNDIKAILQDMFVGGIDTTATILEWAMTELVKNPDKMKKVQEEVRNVINKSNFDIEQMEYLKCVVKETLRLHSPAPLLVPRETGTSINLGGYVIPEKATVLINIWSIQMDPKIWDKPEEFIPERYMNNPIDYKGFDFEYLPFGTGRRGCPGMTFGVASIEYVLANFLYWFDWKLFGSQEVDMSEVYGLTVTKRLPLLLEAIPYSSA